MKTYATFLLFLFQGSLFSRVQETPSPAVRLGETALELGQYIRDDWCTDSMAARDQKVTHTFYNGVAPIVNDSMTTLDIVDFFRTHLFIGEESIENLRWFALLGEAMTWLGYISFINERVYVLDPLPTFDWAPPKTAVDYWAKKI